MKELQKIREVYHRIDFSRRKAALATVVRVEGSSYRRPGARMLMTDDGHWEGAISGGCLEGDALRKARQVILDGKPMLVTYDTMNDDANSLGVGLGCNGIIDVLIEPIHPADENNPVRRLEKLVSERITGVCATVIRTAGVAEVEVGSRWLWTEDQTTESVPSHFISGALLTDMTAAYISRKSGTQQYLFPSGAIEVFVEVIRPEISLIIFGGGYDAIPVAKLAREQGWHVTVTDDCVAHLAPKRFPTADAVIHADRKAILDKITINDRTAALLMSHNYKYDLAVFETLLSTSVPYIGLLGPRKRFEKMLEELDKQGFSYPSESLQRVHSPVGLDIGAETPDEIALAIISEITAFFNKRTGAFLKDKPGPIHDRETQGTRPATLYVGKN